MSTNGNGRWMRSYWTRGGSKVVPREPGWYAAIPESCSRCMVRVHIEPNLFDCYVEGEDVVHDIFDYDYWYKLKNPHDRLPDFPE